jgi:hypothetical protein
VLSWRVRSLSIESLLELPDTGGTLTQLVAPQVELRDAVFEVRDIESQSPELDSGLGFLGYAQSGGSHGHPYLPGTVDVDSLLSPYCVERYGPNSRVLTMEEVIFQTVGNLPPGVSGIVDEFHNNGYVFLSSWDNEFAKTGSGCGYVRTFPSNSMGTRGRRVGIS